MQDGEKEIKLTSGMSNTCGPVAEGLYSTSSASATEDVILSPALCGLLDKYKTEDSFFFKIRIRPLLLVFGTTGAGIGIL